MTSGARGEGIFGKKKRGGGGWAGWAQRGGGGARLGRQDGPWRGEGRLGRRGAHAGGEGGGWAAWAKGTGAVGPNGEKGGERKRKGFSFSNFHILYMPNSPIHSTANKRVHNPA
jgi:hypothetical protein